MWPGLASAVTENKRIKCRFGDFKGMGEREEVQDVSQTSLGIWLDGNANNWHLGCGRRSQFDEQCCDFTLTSYDITTWNFICKAF